jgi:hypothetical protein
MNIGFKCKSEEEEIYEKSHVTGDTKSTHKTKLNTFEYSISKFGIPGILSVLIFIMIFLIAIIQVIQGRNIELPSLFTEIATLIIGFYFGSNTQSNIEENKEKKQIGFKKE